MELDLHKEIPNYIMTHFSIFNHHGMMKFTALISRGLERKLISVFESHFQDLQRRFIKDMKGPKNYTALSLTLKSEN